MLNKYTSQGKSWGRLILVLLSKIQRSSVKSGILPISYYPQQTELCTWWFLRMLFLCPFLTTSEWNRSSAAWHQRLCSQPSLFIYQLHLSFPLFHNPPSISMTYLPLFIYHLLWPFLPLVFIHNVFPVCDAFPHFFILQISTHLSTLKCHVSFLAVKLSAATSYLVSAFTSSIRLFSAPQVLNI